MPTRRSSARELPVLLFAGWLVMLWILAGVATVLALALARRTSLDRVYHRLDLNDRDGKPANTKVLYTFGVFAGWTAVAAWGTVLVVGYVTALRQWAQASQALPFPESPLNAPFVTLVVLMIAASAGADVLKAALKARFGGLADAVQERERRRPEAIAAAATAAEQIRQRRQLGAEDGTEPV